MLLPRAELGAKTVATVGIRNSEVLSGTDIFCEEEAELEKLFSQHKTVIADPLSDLYAKRQALFHCRTLLFREDVFLKISPI